MVKGFTLIETIVSLAIVAVLAAIVASALSFGIHAAKNADCANNLAEIQTGLRLYCQENDGGLPPYSWLKLNSKSENGEFKAAILPLIGSSKVFYCPLDPDARMHLGSVGPFPDHFESSYTLYDGIWSEGLNSGGVGWSLNSAQIESTSMPIFVDSYIAGTGQDFVTGHGSELNAVFWDGHTKSFSTSSTPSWKRN